MYKDTYFEWEEEKDSANISKHNISFFEARQAFADPKRILLTDSRHSEVEKRMFCIGLVNGIIIMVRFVKRGKRIRIFGAGAWRQAKSLYEQENNI
ncbi:BrnT family toxin [Candidatus Woesebacteria bacterium]|nr:BrnT family toxin [Candidatus Woesebacteria bacterium]